MKLTQSVLLQQHPQPPSPLPLQLCHRRYFILIFVVLLVTFVPVCQCKSIKSVRKTILSANNLLEDVNVSGGLTKSELTKALLNLLAATNNNTFEIATAVSNQLDEFRNSNNRNDAAGNDDDDTNEPNAVWSPSIQEFVPARYINNNKNKNNYFDLEERVDLMGVGGRVRNSYDSTTTMNSFQQQQQQQGRV